MSTPTRTFSSEETGGLDQPDGRQAGVYGENIEMAWEEVGSERRSVGLDEQNLAAFAGAEVESVAKDAERAHLIRNL
jgi:hypothetical protein